MDGVAHSGRTLLPPEKMEIQNANKGFKRIASTYHEKAREMRLPIEKLKEILFETLDSKEVEK